MREAKKHLVDGRWVTVAELADELGVTPQQLYSQKWQRRASYQVVANMIRENQVLNDQGGAQRWMVDGRWLTIRQAAEMLGVSYYALRDYMYQHHHPDGTPMTLGEAVDYYRAGLNRRRGKPPARYRVGRRDMTIAEAAEMLGMPALNLRMYMSRHKISLAKAVRYYEQKKRKKAERAILDILTGVT